jgi:type IV pilus assembly protein PilA
MLDMRHYPPVAQKGLTLLELLITVAILGILAAIAVPAYRDYMVRAKVTEALAMGSAAKVAVVESAAAGRLEDVTQDSSGYSLRPDPSRYVRTIEIEDGGVIVMSTRGTGAAVDPVLELIPTATGGGVQWECLLREGLASHVPATCRGEAGSFYNLAQRDPTDFLRVGQWTIGADGFRSETGRLYMNNPATEYDLVVNATLGPGTNGGFSVLFDTSLGIGANGSPNPNADTGFSMQFDRAYNGFVVRQRTNGGEAVPMSLINTNHNGQLTSRGGAPNNTLQLPYAPSDSWWTQPHEISMSIRETGRPGIKTLSVKLDGEVAFSGLEFESNPNSSYAGLRAWTAPTDFHSVTIR